MRQGREEASKGPPLVRWYVLFLFSVFAYAQCANWMTFSCVPKYSKQVYNMTASDVRTETFYESRSSSSAALVPIPPEYLSSSRPS